MSEQITPKRLDELEHAYGCKYYNGESRQFEESVFLYFPQLIAAARAALQRLDNAENAFDIRDRQWKELRAQIRNRDAEIALLRTALSEIVSTTEDTTSFDIALKALSATEIKATSMHDALIEGLGNMGCVIEDVTPKPKLQNPGHERF